MIKFYKNGLDFYNENCNIVNCNELYNKTLNIKTFDVSNYCIKISEYNKYIYAISDSINGLTIIGDKSLIEEIAKIIYIYNLKFNSLECALETAKSFIKNYSVYTKGKFELQYNNENVKYKYYDGNIDYALFAGGCFWCIASNYYGLNGVLEVYSGYTGGNVFFPTYELVKAGNTGHKEAIYIIYDKSQISYYELLKIFFENIDPFDDEGQFIDRGSNYQTAVFTSSPDKRQCYFKIKEFIEQKYHKKIKVPLFYDSVFYLAEDEHQNFAIKNKKRFHEEELISGRLKYKGVKID